MNQTHQTTSAGGTPALQPRNMFGSVWVESPLQPQHGSQRAALPQHPDQTNGFVVAPASYVNAERHAPASTAPRFHPHQAYPMAHPRAAAPAVWALSPAPARATMSCAAPPGLFAASVFPAPVAPLALASPAPAPQQINPYACLHAQQQLGQQGIPQARGYNAQGPVNAQPFSPGGGPQSRFPGHGVHHRAPIMNHVPLEFNPNDASFQPAFQHRPGRPAGHHMNRGGPGYPPQMQGPFHGMQQGYNPYQHVYGYGEFQPRQYHDQYQYQYQQSHQYNNMPRHDGVPVPWGSRPMNNGGFGYGPTVQGPFMGEQQCYNRNQHAYGVHGQIQQYAPRQEEKEKHQKGLYEKRHADKEKGDPEAAAAAGYDSGRGAQKEKNATDPTAATKASDFVKAAVETACFPELTDAKPSVVSGQPSVPSVQTLERATLCASDAVGGQSAVPQPRASPALSHAPSPLKSELTQAVKSVAPQTDVQRENAPTAPNVEASSPATASSSALGTVKVIEDIRSIAYPTGIAAPNPALNQSTSTGKFRYDREFMLQFQNICTAKVPTAIPLDVLGIDKDQPRDSGDAGGRSASQRGGQRGGHRGSQMGGLGGADMIKGDIGSFQKGSGGGMSQSGTMGDFSRPRQTSEERLAASRANMGAYFAAARNSQGGISRTTSQPGPVGNMVQGGRGNDFRKTRSAPGKQRGGEGRGPMTTTISEQNVAPLEASANRWTPSVQNRRPGGLDEGSPEFVERKVKGLLNKLTAERFDSISNQILEWVNKSANEKDGQTLRLVIKLIFEKAKDEQFWSSVYATLCQKLWHGISPEVKDDQMLAANGKPLSGGLLFRKYLLNRCQEDFEKGWKQKAVASVAAREKATDDQKKKAEHDAAVEAGKEVEEFKFSDEYYVEQAVKRQGLGLVKFVGELFKLEILSTNVIQSCIAKLFSNVTDPDEEDVESLCQLLTTVGAKMEAQPKMAQQVQLYIQRMKDLAQSEHLTSRIKFMVQDVIELQSHRWQTRSTKGEGGPMTIEQVHAQARAEAEANRVAASHVNMSRSGDSASRGGSRRGQDRGGFSGGPGGDAWTSVGAKLPAKPADMSSFGKINAGSGPTSFGPNSIFGKKKGGKASGDTTPPPISRTPSSNMFSALEGHDGTAEPASPLTDGAPQQRKRLQLQPRTVSSTDVDKPDTPLNEQENMDAIAGSHVPPVGETDLRDDKGMSEGEIDRKIKNDVEELWGAKDQGGTRSPSDIAEYFETLPKSGRTKLAKKLIDDVFRIAKADDTQIVVKGFKLAIEKDLFTPPQAREALMPSIEMLDDLSLDIPLAYEFAADLLVVTKLPQSDVEALADAIESYGQPKISPRDKLLAAVGNLRRQGTHTKPQDLHASFLHDISPIVSAGRAATLQHRPTYIVQANG